MYDLVVDVERAAIRPLPSSNELAMSSPADVVAAPLRKLPATATVPGRTIMQCKRQHLALHFQLVNFQRVSVMPFFRTDLMVHNPVRSQPASAPSSLIGSWL